MGVINYQYRGIQIWGESTYEKYGVMKLLHSIDTKHHSKADIPASPIASGIDNIHIYCLSDSPLLGWAKHINEISEKHYINDKIVILLPAMVRRVSIDYIENVNISVIPYARTLFRMGILLKAALYTDRYKITKKLEAECNGKYFFYQSLRSKDINKISKRLKISPKTAYGHRTYYIRKKLEFKHWQMAMVFFIGCENFFQ